MQDRLHPYSRLNYCHKIVISELITLAESTNNKLIGAMNNIRIVTEI